MELDGVPSGRIDAHRLVAVGREEEVTVIGGDDRMLDSRAGELADRSRQVVDDRVHDLARLKGESRLASVIDLLGADDDDRGSVELLRKLGGWQAQQLIEGQVD